MSIHEQESILNYMLRKNPDATIRDFIEEIENYILLTEEVSQNDTGKLIHAGLHSNIHGQVRKRV